MNAEQYFHKKIRKITLYNFIFLIGLLPLHIILIVFYIKQLWIMPQLEASQLPPPAYLVKQEAFYESLTYINWVFVAVTILASIIWLIWLYRSYRFAKILNWIGIRHSAYWVIACHIIPFVNFVAPYMVTRDIFLATSNKLENFSIYRKKGAQLIIIWWLTFILGLIVPIIFSNWFQLPETAGEMKTELMIYIISEILSATATILSIFVIKLFFKAQIDAIKSISILEAHP